MTANPPKYEPENQPPFNESEYCSRYVLKYRKPVVCPDFKKWGKWYSNILNRRVRTKWIHGSWVSTVFLGIDSGSFIDNHEPILFETMIFFDALKISKTNVIFDRCCTWREALAMHKMAINEVVEYQIYKSSESK